MIAAAFIIGGFLLMATSKDGENVILAIWIILIALLLHFI